ncbi:hypothetical protein QBC33DRAFT_384661 [Phialemonium atrogriseum]|uniref:Uncharacterized protein n=1 Tax=Phialemonium atrogriseum TaxID=1093897 RepID=A0AAJ0FPY5_9PEZI|nr:uncharacterized protein QBC33DRAFT_384661 [Phialemonium atrogriseum]KAK1768615.1 hypothetical protein QBC33DRAFT_384661 [Phialemonium atrogriseum]
MDDSFCGGPDGSSLNLTGTLISDAVAKDVASNILMGDPRYVAGLSFNVWNTTAGGVSTHIHRYIYTYIQALAVHARAVVLTTARSLSSSRPAHRFQMSSLQSRIQSYYDSPDPFCSNGTSPEHHQGYGREYGADALAFVVSKKIVG